jgi:hypothetical protein
MSAPSLKGQLTESPSNRRGTSTPHSRIGRYGYLRPVSGKLEFAIRPFAVDEFESSQKGMRVSRRHCFKRSSNVDA